MTHITATKTGRIELDKPIRVENIRLYCITLYMDMYNLTEPTEYVYQGKKTVIPPGYYTYEYLKRTLEAFKVHENTLKVVYGGTLTGGLKKLIDNGRLYMTPLALYLYVEGIDTSKNLFDGKRSDLLSVIPVGKTEVSEIFQYQPRENYKQMYGREINSLTLSIKDIMGNEYTGKFVAEIELK